MAEETSEKIETATVRRSPKYAVFLALGAGLGVLVALILTFGFHGTDDVSANTGLVYSQTQVFGFLALICIAFGLALGGIVALIIDRSMGRSAHDVRIDHERIREVN